MSKENPQWGAARIHGELLMLGFEVAQSTVSKYMVRGRNPPSQTWKTFLRNHAQAIAAIDMCVVPTLSFDLLFAFLVLGHGRRQLLWIEVTRHPTAEWLARQITEAFPWSSAPAYLVRDNDGAYGYVFTRRLRAMGIRDRPISPRSPWQNGHTERLIGTLRRECLDRMLIFGEQHLRCVLGCYAAYYNQARKHLALQKDAPLHRAVQRSGAIAPFRFWLGCITNTSGYDFRKGQEVTSSFPRPFSHKTWSKKARSGQLTGNRPRGFLPKRVSIGHTGRLMHLIIFGDAHLRWLLRAYARYYNVGNLLPRASGRA